MRRTLSWLKHAHMSVFCERVSVQRQGPIPESLSLLQSLEELWLNGNRLSGSIPEGLGHLPRLRELYLNANELVGCIPSSFSELVRLEGLNLSWNKLSGDFPSCLGNMVRSSRRCYARQRLNFLVHFHSVGTYRVNVACLPFLQQSLWIPS